MQYITKSNRVLSQPKWYAVFIKSDSATKCILKTMNRRNQLVYFTHHNVLSQHVKYERAHQQLARFLREYFKYLVDVWGVRYNI